jgi:hypothetical protein
LYQRGIYPQDTFKASKQYGLTVFVTAEDGLSQYLATVLQQMQGTQAHMHACMPASWLRDMSGDARADIERALAACVQAGLSRDVWKSLCWS